MDQTRILFEGWPGVVSAFTLAVLGYASLLFLIRVAGKRTIAKMNVFDFVVVVALGSTVANTALSSNIVLAEGFAAFVALIGLQYLFSILTIRSSWLNHMINGEPSLLLCRGTMLRGAMRKQRVTEEEVLAAVRAASVADLAEVEAVVLETDGTFSVMRLRDEVRYTALRDIPHYTPRSERSGGGGSPGERSADDDPPPGSTASRHP
jgi:uncharacterized membrane protein YcaP (DUF421 family)